MAQLFYRHLVFEIEDDASISAENELASVHFSKGVDQRCLAVKEHGVLSFLRFDLVDADEAATFGLCCEVAGLPPFQGFFQFTHAVCS